MTWMLCAVLPCCWASVCMPPWPSSPRRGGSKIALPGLEGLFDEFLWAVHGFRMPVFFLMSGFFTALLWRRRGLGALLNHRLRRVALPLLIGMFTIVPLTGLVGDWAVGSALPTELAADDIFGQVFAGNVAGAEKLLERGIDVDLRSETDGWTLLHAAALTGNTEMLELLLSRGPSRRASPPLRKARHRWGWPSTSAMRKPLICSSPTEAETRSPKGGVVGDPRLG